MKGVRNILIIIISNFSSVFVFANTDYCTPLVEFSTKRIYNEGTGVVEDNLEVEPGQKYIIKFKQSNNSEYTSAYSNNPPSAARFVLKVNGNIVSEDHSSMYITSGDLNWYDSLIIYENESETLISIEILVENLDESYINGYPDLFEDTEIIMSIKDFMLYKEGDCEPFPVINDRDHSSFAPNPGESYVVSAWIQEEHPLQVATYSSSVNLSFEGSSTTFFFAPTGAIIEGWQRIEGVFTIPIGSTDLHIALTNNAPTGSTFYDDIRFHKATGNMKSFVYDPITQRLMAELDENNYATIYEYDNEGGLIRVKKETEKGIYTIQETRSGNSKINIQN